MKQKNESIILSFLQHECEFGKFQLVEKQDMLAALDKFVDANELDSLLLSLERQGYVKIKYEDDNVYCLSLSKKEVEEKREQNHSLSLFYFLSFVAAFLGGMLGAIISKIF